MLQEGKMARNKGENYIVMSIIAYIDNTYAFTTKSNDSKKLLAELGFDNVVVAGDTRFDRVAEIAAAAKKIDL